MNYLELSKTVEKSFQNSCHIHPNDNVLDTEHWEYDEDAWEKQTSVTQYWYTKWMCTDTWVGGSFIFLYDKPIAVTWQSARKSNEEIFFFSREDKQALYNFFAEFEIYGEVDVEDIIDINKEIIRDDSTSRYTSDGYRVEFSGQILNKVAFYRGEQVSIVETFDSYEDIKKWHDVVVQFDDGNQAKVNLDEVRFPWGK